MKSIFKKPDFLESRKYAFSEQFWLEQVRAQNPAQLYAPHFDGKRFFNPWLRRERSWQDMAAYFLDKAPTRQAPPSHHDILFNYSYLHDKDAPDSLTWLGHASVALQAQGQLVLLDPFLSERAFTIRREFPPAARADSLPRKCLVIISHNHYDHLDRFSVTYLKDSFFICPLGMGRLLRRWGVRKIKELDWWQSIQWRDITINCLPAHHWSRRLEQGTNRSLWASYLLEFNRCKVYFAGDSAYFSGYKEIGAKYSGVDVALLPCGAYAPRWFMHQVHMNVNEMFLAFNDLGARFLLPIHWGAIALGHEPVNQPGQIITEYIQTNPAVRQSILPLNQGQKILFSELQC